MSRNKKRNKAFTLLLLCLLNIATFSSLAGNIEHINIGRIALDDQSMNSQQEAGKQALAQVFIKLSGNKNVGQEPEIAKAIDNYEQFLISSSFIQHNNALLFEASFNQARVENLLLASGLSVWASLRPAAIIWLAIENESQDKILLTQHSASEVINEIDRQAFARGVEVHTPIGDLEDAMNISVYDVWNQFISKLQEQSLRYGSDYLISATVQTYDSEKALLDQRSHASFFNQESALLDDDNNGDDDILSDEFGDDYVNEGLEDSDLNNIADIDNPELEDLALQQVQAPKERVRLANIPVPEGTSHKLDYVITQVDYSLSKKVNTGRVFGESEDDVILKLVDIYADMLAQEFASNARLEGHKESIVVSVSGIDSLQDYVNVLSLMRSIPAVDDVRLLKQFNDIAILSLEQKISISQLKSILTLDSRLSSETPAIDSAISFRWQDE